MASHRRVRVSYIMVPLASALVVALAAFSYIETRASITTGPLFAAPGTQPAGDALAVAWRIDTETAIIVSFTPSRTVRVRSVTLSGLDPKSTYVASEEYGFWDARGKMTLPTFTSSIDRLPPYFHPHELRGAFIAPAHRLVVVRIVVRANSDAKGTAVLNGFRVDCESWGWAHTTFLPLLQPVKLEQPR